MTSITPGDYENWEGTLIKLGGHNINLEGHQWSKLKILHYPHKIWGSRASPVPYTPGAHDDVHVSDKYIFISYQH